MLSLSASGGDRGDGGGGDGGDGSGGDGGGGGAPEIAMLSAYTGRLAPLHAGERLKLHWRLLLTPKLLVRLRAPDMAEFWDRDGEFRLDGDDAAFVPRFLADAALREKLRPSLLRHFLRHDVTTWRRATELFARAEKAAAAMSFPLLSTSFSMPSSWATQRSRMVPSNSSVTSGIGPKRSSSRLRKPCSSDAL